MDTYRATNTINGKFYIGSTVNFEERKKAHLNSTANYPFQRALRANPDAFIWEVWSDDSEERILEQALLDMWFGKEQCYNLCPVAESGPPTKPGQMAGEKNPFYGKKHKPESKKLMSEKALGREIPQKTRDRVRETHTGKVVSVETKTKMSTSKRGMYVGCKWWVNSAGETKFQRESPGPGWQNGRVYRFDSGV